jgi:S-DNA-T family DNA segregation ATPase FtsK/SpoIIIE
MSQRGNKRKQAPTYSADTLALRFIAGLALIALGAVIFMAVDLRMPGNIFEGLRQVCFGLCGSLGMMLAVLPLWAGGLVIWSTQRRAPVKPWLFALLSFLGICAFIMLISGNALEHLTQQYGGTWNGAVQGAYRDCAKTGTGGGSVGVAIAWPLWRFLGTVLGTVIIFLLTVFCALMAAGLTPLRIRDLVTGRAGLRRQQQQDQRRISEQEQMAWQQEQARQQAAWQQQQARIIEEQQAAQRQAMAQQPSVSPVQGSYMPQGSANTGRSASVENWQDQFGTQQLAAQSGGGHLSRIFGKSQQESAGDERPRKSRIFSKKEEYDGLSDGSTLMGEGSQRAAQQLRAENERKTRRTVTGEVIGKPETQWTLGQRQEPEPETPPVRKSIWPSERKQEEETEFRGRTEENRSTYQRPVQGKEPEEAEPPKPADKPARDTRKVREERSGRESVSVTKETETTETPAKPKVPTVQMTVGVEAYQPPLKLPDNPKKVIAPEDEYWEPVPYYAPPLTDLAKPKQNLENTAAEDEMRSRRLEETLASFKVQARVVNVTHGPAISRFEMELAAGTKVGKVAELEKDIAYGMEATSVRIEAPIPGKSLVGVEVPNRKVTPVTLREVLESEKMQSAKSLLTVALGKDIAGTPIVCDLAKMPHMLIAGQTGSGKSVCINAIINSLLFRASPDEVKMILVDPKVVELQCYNGIPHLLIPVVNDPHKAAAALAWAVAEMMERYDRFAERKVRNLDGYNAALGPHEKPMSRIVIIIDELADLMMVCKKDVEEYICRLTQLARAAGIHLIVATQRPSVDVITGLIKANIPSRIAFKTASSVDSRTILDRNGSEQLLGWGDMLYLPTGSFAPTRVQGCFLSDEEVNRIASHVREANPSTYDPNILEKLEEIASGGGETTGADMISGYGDPAGGDGNLFEQAVEFAIADGQISTSTLQRRLKIGYARAGRLTDEMEERGIVAAKDGSKPRKCLITREEWESMKQSTEGMT